MDTGELVALFRARAEAAAAQTDVVPDEAAVQTAIARMTGSFGVVRAAKGVAATGTCVVVADDEKLRLETMLPETSVIVLRAADLVADLEDLAPFLRDRQRAASYVSFITGPSRTADIERVGAIGVHGPLALRIILVEG